MASSRPDAPRLAMLLPTLHVGGAERAVVHLLQGMASHGVPLDLLLERTEGPLLAELPDSVRVVDLGCRRTRAALAPLVGYLRNVQPAALISHLNHVNVVATIAHAIARSRSQLVLVEHSTFSSRRHEATLSRRFCRLIAWAYRRADTVIGVSQGVARDLESQLRLPVGHVRVMPNPVVTPALLSRAAEEPAHPWLRDGGPPVLVTAGRLTAAKDHVTLLRAFALLRRERRVRLILLGEGEERPRLEALCAAENLADDVAMPGLVVNPLPYFKHASRFVLSSRVEGLPTALIEALACGLPVVATDCPSGPREILEGARYGLLAPVGDPPALAAAISASLERRWDRTALARRGRDFSCDRAVSEYLRAAGWSDDDDRSKSHKAKCPEPDTMTLGASP